MRINQSFKLSSEARLTQNEHTIILYNAQRLRFHALHGVLPQERTVGNDYIVDLRIGCDISEAMHTDNVSHTLNYAEVFDVVRSEMAVPSNLLEHVAGRICNSLLNRFAIIASIYIKVEKLNPPMGADCHGAAVELTVSR